MQCLNPYPSHFIYSPTYPCARLNFLLVQALMLYVSFLKQGRGHNFPILMGREENILNGKL